jgi:hypothetical protein
MPLLSALVYYLFLLVGGVGFGYFVLRITNPDVRLMSSNEKLGASAVYGFGLLAVALAIDFVISGTDAFLNATGYLPATLFFTIISTTFFLKVKSMFFQPQYLVVGVPAQKTVRAEAREKPSEKKEPAALGFRPVERKMEVEEKRKPKSVSGFLEGVKQALGKKKQDVEVKGFKSAWVSGERKPVVAVAESEEEKQKELQKLKQAEEELIIKQFSGEKLGENEGVEEEELRKKERLEEEAAELRKRKEEAAKEKPLGEEEEFDVMVQEVYNQIQVSKERAFVSDKLKISPPPAETPFEKLEAQGQPTQQKPSGGLFEKLEQVNERPAAGPSSLFDQLSVISGGKSEKQESDVQFIQLPANGAGCPRCHSNTARIVFCPYCGSGMCANCSPLIKALDDGFEYTCPKCGENVFVKKQG